MNIPTNKTLTDVINIDLNVSSHIIAPTGSGKGYWMCKHLTTKRIVCVPTQALVGDFASSYGGSVYHGDTKDLHNENLIVVTYDSLSSLQNALSELSLFAKDYILFIDEVHNVVAAGYRLQALNSMMDIVGQFKAYHLVTATYLHCEHPMWNVPAHVFTSESIIPKTIQPMGYTDSVSTVVSLSNYAKSVNTLMCLVLNDTQEDGKLGAVKAAITTNTGCINSKTKHTALYDAIINDNMLPADLDVLICTSILKEGNSILNNYDNVIVVFNGVYHPIEIEQFCARFRNTKHITGIVLKKDVVEATQSVDIEVEDYDYDEMSMEEQAKLAGMTSNEQPQEDVRVEFRADVKWKQIYELANLTLSHFCIGGYSNEDLPSYIKVNMGLIRVSKDRSVTINHAYVANCIYNEEMLFANKHFWYMTDYLTNYGWVVGSDLRWDTELDTDTKDNIKLAKQEHKDMIDSVRTQILDVIALNSPTQNVAIVSSMKRCTSDKMRLEKELRSKIAYLNHLTDNPTESINILASIGYNTSSWTKFCKHASMKKAIMTASNSHLAKFANVMYSKFNIGDIMTSDAISSIVNDIRVDVYDAPFALTNNKITSIVKLFFDISETKTYLSNDSDVRVKATKIKAKLEFMPDAKYDRRSECDKLMSIMDSFDIDFTSSN